MPHRDIQPYDGCDVNLHLHHVQAGLVWWVDRLVRLFAVRSRDHRIGGRGHVLRPVRRMRGWYLHLHSGWDRVPPMPCRILLRRRRLGLHPLPGGRMVLHRRRLSMHQLVPIRNVRPNHGGGQPGGRLPPQVRGGHVGDRGWGDLGLDRVPQPLPCWHLGSGAGSEHLGPRLRIPVPVRNVRRRRRAEQQGRRLPRGVRHGVVWHCRGGDKRVHRMLRLPQVLPWQPGGDPLRRRIDCAMRCHKHGYVRRARRCYANVLCFRDIRSSAGLGAGGLHFGLGDLPGLIHDLRHTDVPAGGVESDRVVDHIPDSGRIHRRVPCSTHRPHLQAMEPPAPHERRVPL